MSNLVRKTITIPGSLYTQVRLLAASTGENFSSYIVKILDQSMKGRRQKKSAKNPLDALGQFSIGIKLAYKKRGDLYDDYLKRKMGI